MSGSEPGAPPDAAQQTPTAVLWSSREDRSYGALEELLSEALPVLVHKPRLLVLGANFCTLGLMMGRLEPAAGEASVSKINHKITLIWSLSQSGSVLVTQESPLSL